MCSPRERHVCDAYSECRRNRAGDTPTLQCLFFSATYDAQVMEFAQRIVSDDENKHVIT
jgi:superfamily II DNA/RNA helicase